MIILIALLYASMPGVSRACWIFGVMATQVYLITFVLMFIAAIRLRRSTPVHARGYMAPALGLLGLLGAVSSVAALVIGLVPPSQFSHSSPLGYGVLMLAGILVIGIVPPLLTGRLCQPGWKASGGGSTPGAGLHSPGNVGAGRPDARTASGSAFEDEWNFDAIAVDGGNRTAGHSLSSLVGEDLAGTSRWR